MKKRIFEAYIKLLFKPSQAFVIFTEHVNSFEELAIFPIYKFATCRNISVDFYERLFQYKKLGLLEINEELPGKDEQLDHWDERDLRFYLSYMKAINAKILPRDHTLTSKIAKELGVSEGLFKRILSQNEAVVRLRRQNKI